MKNVANVLLKIDPQSNRTFIEKLYQDLPSIEVQNAKIEQRKQEEDA